MIGKYVVWTENSLGSFGKAFVHVGKMQDGIDKAKEEAYSQGVTLLDVWATPVSNRNKKVPK